jgi:hypothetical protein
LVSSAGATVAVLASKPTAVTVTRARQAREPRSWASETDRLASIGHRAGADPFEGMMRRVAWHSDEQLLQLACEITDAQAATDPAYRDGVGRTCETADVRDRAGKLVSRQMACRPANAAAARPVIGAGFSLLPDDRLFVRGSVAAEVDRVTISDHGADIQLRPEPGTGRRSFYVIVPLKEYEIIATAKDGRELGRTSINP